MNDSTENTVYKSYAMQLRLHLEGKWYESILFKRDNGWKAMI